MLFNKTLVIKVSNIRQNAIFLFLLHNTYKEQLRTICCHQLFIVTNIDNLLNNSLATLIVLSCKSIHKVSKNQESLEKKGYRTQRQSTRGSYIPLCLHQINCTIDNLLSAVVDCCFWQSQYFLSGFNARASSCRFPICSKLPTYANHEFQPSSVACVKSDIRHQIFLHECLSQMGEGF